MHAKAEQSIYHQFGEETINNLKVFIRRKDNILYKTLVSSRSIRLYRLMWNPKFRLCTIYYYKLGIIFRIET